MMEAWVSLTPLQRAAYTLLQRSSNTRKMRAAMRVFTQHSLEEREEALSVLVALGFIEERNDRWL